MEANGGQVPKKKSFWRRTNRGFWVSMALLLIVVIYVVVSQLMLVAQRPDIRGLAEKVNTLWNSATLLTDEEAAALAESPEKQEALKAQIKTGLQDLFCANSDYLDAGVDLVYGEAEQQFNGAQRSRTRQAENASRQEKWNIVEDTATLSLQFSYTSAGEYYNYSAGSQENAMIEKENVEERLFLSLVLKKENGQWKIFRIGQLFSTNYYN